MLEELGADVRGAPLGRVRPARPGGLPARRSRGAEVVIHLAASVGGIGFNRRNPAPLAYDNLMMGTNVFEASPRLGVEKLVAACSVCAYPHSTPVPFSRGDDLGRLPGGVERPLRPGEEDAARALRRLPAPVRVRLVRAGDRQPLRARRQLRPRGLPRDRGDDPQVRRGRRARRPRRSSCGAPASRRASSSTSTTRPGRWCSRPSGSRPPSPVNIGTGEETRIRDLAETIAAPGRVRGRDRLGHRRARRPADALPRRQPGPRADRLRGRDRPRGRPGADDRLVQGG